MRYLNPLRYIHYHTQLAIPTIYDDSLSFYEIMNKTNLHFNEVINDMNENYEIIDKAFQEVLEQTNKWMEEAKAQADRAEQEANKSQASAEASQQAAEDARNQANRAASEADRAKNEADNSAASAVEAQKQADRASSEADRAHTEAENAKSQAEAAANSAQESASSAAASADSASESAASATESKNSADASAASATASQNSAVASANSASQAAQSATDAANSAKEAADTLDEAKETFVKKAGDTMSGKLTISYGGLSVDGSADISGDLNTGRLQVGKPAEKGNSYLYGNLELNGILTMSIDGNSALAFSNINEGLKLYAPLKFDGSPQNISNVANPQEALDAVNKQTLDSSVTSINASLSQVNEKITSLTSRMDTAEKNITSLTSRVTTNETNINNINTEITNIKQDITTVEGDYVKKAGDTMTGNLTMGLNQIVMDTGHIAAGNNTLLFEGYPEIDVDGAKISMVADPVDVMDATNKKYVDDAVANVKPTGDYLPLTGGTMSGDINMGVNNSVRFGAANYALYQNKGTGHLVLTGNSNTDIVEMNNIGTVQFGNETTIRNIKTPTNNGDAAPKSYVDGQIAVAKNDVQEHMQGYLPLNGGKLSGNLLMGTGAQIDFEEGAHLAYATEFGFGVQTNGGSVGIVSNNIVHTDTPIALNSKLITYSISDVSVVPGTTVKQYNCDGTGFQQMRFSGFQNVKFASSLLVDEDPSEAMQVATKQYVDQHAGGGGEQTYYDASAQMVFKIKLLHESTGLYTCDCYYISTATKHISINSGKTSGSLELSHTLNDFLTENGYSFKTSYMNLVSVNTETSGFSSNHLCSLGRDHVTLWCTSPTPVSSNIDITFRLYNGLLCSAILRK
jgi:hypothetical protein